MFLYLGINEAVKKFYMCYMRLSASKSHSIKLGTWLPTTHHQICATMFTYSKIYTNYVIWKTFINSLNKFGSEP